MTYRKLSRRGALGVAGGALALSFAGGWLRMVDRDGEPIGDAYEPWRVWDDPRLRETPLALISAAVLAANPHDTQPWLFRVDDKSIQIFADLSRSLGAMDPFVREMHLGVGCAIENMLVAAGPNGYAAELAIADGSLLSLTERQRPVPTATLRLSRCAPTAPDSHYQTIPHRHTNRYAYDRRRQLPGDWLDFARSADVDENVRLFLFADGGERSKFDAAVVEATQGIIADAEMIADSDRWFRGSAREIDAHRDGPTLEAAGLSLATLTFARLFAVSPETSHNAWLRQTRDTQIATAPLTGLVAVRDRYDRRSAISAGRTWQRLHLEATARGIAMQPLNQPLEMIDRERQKGDRAEWSERIAELTGKDWQATFAFRSGYASQTAPPSPRRRLESVLLS